MNTRVRAARAVLLLCLGAAAVGAAEGDAAADFERGERYFAAKDYTSALPVYKNVLDREPKGPYAAAAGLRIGMCNFALGEYADAAAVLAKFEEGWPASPYLDDATFLAAQAYFRMGEHHRSFERLLRVVSFGKDGRYYDRAVRGLGNLADEALTAEFLRKRLEDYTPSPEAAEVLLKLAKHEIKRDDYEKAVVILDDVARRYGDAAAGQEAKTLLESVREKLGRAPSTVGALLPLTGDFAPYGVAMKAAVELAAQRYNDAHPDRPVTVVVEDTAGTDAGAVDAARRLIYTNRVIALIGPASTAEVRAVAPFCETNQVPLLSPAATDDSLCDLNGYVYLCGLTAESETACMATYAIKKLRLKRLGCLYPANAYGREMRDAFKKAVAAAGGNYVGDVEYPLIDMTKEPDKREINYAPYTKQVKWLRAEGVYIPGHYAEVVRLLPQLSFSDVSSFLLGANGWNENRVMRVGAKYVEGTYFTAGFWADSPDAQARSFYEDYRRATAAFPNYLAAQAYDTATLTFGALTPPLATGADLKSRLDALRGYRGVTGEMTLRGRENRLSKTLTILTVREGEVVEAPE